MSDQPPPGPGPGRPGWVPPPGPGTPVGPPGPRPGAWPAPPGKRFGGGAVVAAGLVGLVVGAVGLLLVLGVVAAVLGLGDGKGKAEGTYGPLTESASLADAGTCFSVRTELADLTSADQVVPCTQRHASEVIGTVDLPELRGLPRGTALDDFTSGACGLLFRSFVGGDPKTTSLHLAASVPNRLAWESGERTVLCSVDASRTTSVRRPGS